MRKLIIIIFVLIFCDIAYADNSNFSFDLSKEEGIKLLKGEKSIALLMQASSQVKDKIKKDVFSDIELKFRLIGLEPSNYKWGVPFLKIILSLAYVNDDLYSGKIGLAFLMTAEYQKGGVPSYAKVWGDSLIFANAHEQHIRDSFRNMMDKFLSVYLEANPRKFVDDTPEKKQQ